MPKYAKQQIFLILRKLSPLAKNAQKYANMYIYAQIFIIVIMFNIHQTTQFTSEKYEKICKISNILNINESVVTSKKYTKICKYMQKYAKQLIFLILMKLCLLAKNIQKYAKICQIANIFSTKKTIFISQKYTKICKYVHI